ncbi:hypothetical protein AYK81_24810 [Bacillus thuringiensis]|nr:hypothetical protein AYK81_24810 [Bacillus thuringiensis]
MKEKRKSIICNIIFIIFKITKGLIDIDKDELDMTYRSKISKIHRITLPVPGAIGSVHIYLIEGKELTLIDVGINTKESWEVLTVKLEELGYSPSDIKHIVLTHHHADHVGLLDYFPEGIKIYGHFKTDPWINRDTILYQQFESFINTYKSIYGIPENFQSKLLHINDSLSLSCNRSLTNFISEGDEIPSIPDFKIIETPGHSSTHICLYREKDGILIGGDILIQNVFLNTMLEPPGLAETERPKLLVQYNESVEKLKQLPIKSILPGHGEEILDMHALIEQQLKKQKKRMKRVIRILNDKPQTVFEICTKLFVGFYEIHFLLALSETVGILDLLEKEKQIEMNCLQGEWLYQISK